MCDEAEDIKNTIRDKSIEIKKELNIIVLSLMFLGFLIITMMIDDYYANKRIDRMEDFIIKMNRIETDSISRNIERQTDSIKRDINFIENKVDNINKR